MNISTDYRNDINSLIKDIVEREKIISDYKKYGILDRDKAINKIQELRIKIKKLKELQLPILQYHLYHFTCHQTSKLSLNLICRKKF